MTAFQISSVLLCLSGNLRDNKKDTFNYDYFWRRSVTAAVSADLMCHLIGKPSEDIFITSPLQDIADSLSSICHGEQRAETIEMIFSTLREKYSLKTARVDELIDTIAGRPVEKLSIFEIPPGGLKPFSQILQEANAEWVITINNISLQVTISLGGSADHPAQGDRDKSALIEAADKW